MKRRPAARTVFPRPRPEPGSGAARLLALAGLAMLTGPLARAQEAPAAAPAPQPDTSRIQTPPELEPYERRLIRRIILQRPEPRKPGSYLPLEPADDTLARNQLRSKEGSIYETRIVSEDISRLNRLGRFKRVENRVQMLSDGSVNVIFTLVEQPVVQDVQCVGNRRFSDKEITDAVELLTNNPVDAEQLARACRKIEAMYRTKGYYLVQVTVDESELEKTGIVLFRIREGDRVKVSDIRFEGNLSFTPGELKRDLKTREAWLLEKGPLDDDALEQDVATLANFYRDRGYLEVRTDRIVRPSPNGKEAIVTFLVDEGPVYTMRRVEMQTPEDELPVFTPAQLQGLMSIKPGDVYSQDKLRRSMDAISAAYGKLGYTDVRVSRRELRDPDSPQVDILLLIQQGKTYKTGLIEIQGNDITRQNVVRRQIRIQPDRPLDSTELEESRKRLQATQLFNRAGANRGVKTTIQPPSPDDPEHRDVLVEVEETNTGNFSIGVVAGSDGGFNGRIALEQKNFDIGDWPDSAGEFFSGRAFRGAGQTFNMQALPGNETQLYSISLSDPYLLDSNYQGSASLFYSTRDYDEYDEARVGTRFSLGRRFGTRWIGSMPIRVENIDLSNIDPSMPVDVFAVQDPHLLTSVGLQLTRSTLNDTFRPSKGTRMNFGVDQVGLLGGDFNYTSFNAEHSIFLTVNEDFFGYRTVLNLKTRAQYIPQGPDEAPVYERFYLGGQSMRGFAFRTVSPRGIRNDTGTPGDDPVGGTWLFFWGAEITQPVWEDTISIVGFTDTGTVTNDPGFEDYRVSVGIGVRLYFPQLSPAPLAFDFGFPVLKQDTDEDRLFTFSIDLPFR